MPIPTTSALRISDHESLKLSLIAFRDAPTPDAAMDLVDQIFANPEPIPAHVFDLISPPGRAAALISWLGYHLENPTAQTFTLPGTGREW